MPEKRHFVYSARTTEKGLALLNKTKGDKSWDQFISDAVAAHYSLPLDAIALPPSRFLEEQKARREAKAAEKAASKAEREAKAKAAKQLETLEKAAKKAEAGKVKKGKAAKAKKAAAKPVKTETPADDQPTDVKDYMADGEFDTGPVEAPADETAETDREG